KIEGKVAAEPFGIWDSHNAPVSPRSLYYAQLRDRLGPDAVRQVAAAPQLAGSIWDALYDWEGEGVFGPAVAALVSEGSGPPSKTPSKTLRLRVADLRLLDARAETRWEKESGPGRVRFKQLDPLTWRADFTRAGRYTLQAIVEDRSGRRETADVDVFVD
ncbi:MAG: hypothetical protein AAF663_09605, partial [Planctomycetota bacterium]